MPTVTPLTPPTVYVNGVEHKNQVVQDSEKHFTNDGVVLAENTATVVLGACRGCTVRYTLNGRNPTLGSPVYTDPLTISVDGNGFSSDNTILKAKCFRHGLVSKVTKVEIKLV